MFNESGEYRVAQIKGQFACLTAASMQSMRSPPAVQSWSTAQGLIGRGIFAIHGVKLPSNASQERSGTHAELRHRADRLDKAANKILALHQAQDKAGATQALEPKRQAQLEALRKEAARTREFLARSPPRQNRKGQELKTNITDPQSAKMATNKGVIQGYAAQAAVDSAHQIIVAADVIGSGSEQAMLLPMIEQSQPYRDDKTLILHL